MNTDTHMFVLFEDSTCKECRRGIGQLAKLAAMNNTEEEIEIPRIALIDCALNDKLCVTWTRTHSAEERTQPIMFYIHNKFLYQYSQEISA